LDRCIGNGEVEAVPAGRAVSLWATGCVGTGLVASGRRFGTQASARIASRDAYDARQTVLLR